MRHHVTLEPDKRTLITHLIAVVGGAEHGDERAVVVNLETLVFHLVTPHHKLEIVVGEKLFCDVCSESHPYAALTRMTSKFCARVTPQHFTKWTLLGRLTEAIDFLQVVKLNAILGE